MVQQLRNSSRTLSWLNNYFNHLNVNKSGEKNYGHYMTSNMDDIQNVVRSIVN